MNSRRQTLPRAEVVVAAGSGPHPPVVTGAEASGLDRARK